MKNIIFTNIYKYLQIFNMDKESTCNNILHQLEKWIISSDEQAKVFSSCGLESAKIGCESMSNAYKNVRKYIEDLKEDKY